MSEYHFYCDHCETGITSPHAVAEFCPYCEPHKLLGKCTCGDYLPLDCFGLCAKCESLATELKCDICKAMYWEEETNEFSANGKDYIICDHCVSIGFSEKDCVIHECQKTHTII